jgi:hypothetical protein
MMHPNLPGRNDSPYKIFGRKMLYMTLAVVAPEIVTVSAFDDMRRIWRRKKEVGHLATHPCKHRTGLRQNTDTANSTN